MFCENKPFVVFLSLKRRTEEVLATFCYVRIDKYKNTYACNVKCAVFGVNALDMHKEVFFSEIM